MHIDAQGKRWYKGNLHMHTAESDGRRSKEDAYRLYREAGYDFVARTDHWKPSEQECQDGLLVLSGCEYNVGYDVRRGVYHILSIGATSDPMLTRQNTPQEIVDAIHRCDGMAVLAHPAWSLNTPEQIFAVKGFDFTEIFNSVSDLPKNARPYSGEVLDMVAARGLYLPLLATDDTHYFEPYDLCRSYVMVQAEECTRDALLEALRAGRFYASQGPQLYTHAEDGVLYVDCSPVEQIVYYTGYIWNAHRSDIGTDLTRGEFTMSTNDLFVRVEVRDSEGRYAWSPYYPIA